MPPPGPPQTPPMMFEHLFEQRWAISVVLSDRVFTKLTDARTLELTDDRWGVMEELLPVLRSLKCATTALCGESGVALSKHLKVIPGESPVVAISFIQTSSLSKRQF